MKKIYLPNKIEKYVQKYWKKEKTFEVKENKKKKKYYCVAMLPYPSGNLHMGHVRNYTISDVISRYQRMLQKNVLQPMGWDAFGLPAEEASIQNKTTPKKWTKKNIKKMKKQLQLLGFSYDWSREITTCKSKYYKWEQWFFIKLYKKKLVYKKKSPVNWCEYDKTVLANEQVINGKCWRCNNRVIIKIISQWFIKVKKFANNLLNDIKKLKYWPNKIKLMQKNWIGKSKGTEIIFKIKNSSHKIKIFTKKANILINLKYIFLSPLHKISKKFSKKNIKIKNFIKKYFKNYIYIKKKKIKIKIFTKKFAINPITKKKIQIWINNNFNFENNINAKIKKNLNKKKKKNFKIKNFNYNKFKNFTKIKKISYIQKKLKFLKKGGKKTIFKIKDWSVSRQRSWGTPIPMAKIYKTNKIIPLKEKNLPLKKKKKNEIVLINNKKLILENETFDTFLESSWYYIRYTCPNYKKKMIHKKSANYWLPIDQYIGGIEHATMHLIYFRLYHKLLNKFNLIKSKEPAKKLLCQGMVLSDAFYYINKKNKKIWLNKNLLKIKRNKKGQIINFKSKKKKKKIIHAGMIKMSKSKQNGISPKKIIKKYGSDTIRLFIMFSAPIESSLKWKKEGIKGIHKFLHRFWNFIYEQKFKIKNKKTKKTKKEKKIYIKLQKIIKKNSFYMNKKQKFHNVISELISYVNKLIKIKLHFKKNSYLIKKIILIIIKMFYPFIPHFSFIIWKNLTRKKNIDFETWPKINKKKYYKNTKKIIFQINGKKKYILKKIKKTKGKIIKKIINIKKIKKNILHKKIKKIIYIKNKILNFVI
ncbi:class I tRNA ligase family protein [Buchnera aphidicola]|uniref:class I tRNA ligase family protein n=1 Tax=Buchnera aphidicola TaxID=9 RepID=UPI0031B88320